MRAGEIGGVTVYAHPWNSGNFGDCLFVFKVNDEPLWEPVSRERYLKTLMQLVRKEREATLAEMAQAQKEALAAPADKTQAMREAIEQMRKIDPAAAAEMERQMVQAQEMVEAFRAEALKEGPRAKEAAWGMFRKRLTDLQAELDALSPAERAAQAYIGGPDYSAVSMLANSPQAPGARPLVAVNDGCIDASLPPDRVQLLAISLRNDAQHLPETYIIGAARRQMDWNGIWALIRQNREKDSSRQGAKNAGEKNVDL